MVSFDGKGYISTSRAAKLAGYTADYVGQMARAGIIPSRQVGNRWYVEQSPLLKHKESKDALLAAVQVQSVGIRKQPAGIEKGKESIENLPLLRYVSDNRELIPSIASHRDDGGVEETKEEEAQEEEHVIPIHIRHNSQKMAKTQGYSMPVSLEPRKSVLPVLLPIGLFTIVIILSFGFVSLKRSSTYTSNSIESTKRTAQLASAGTSIIGKIGGALEELLVPEMVYQRPR